MPTIIEDPATVALIEEIVHTHRDAARRHERAGQHEQARDELARAEIVASYLPAARRPQPRKPSARG